MLNPLHLYFVPAGRIGQLSYWLAVAALLAVCIVGWPVAVVFAPLTMLLLVYVFTCLSAKRFCDVGMPGWLAAAPVAAMLAYIAVMGVFSILTLGCCGAGTGGGPVGRAIYRFLAGLDAFFIMALPLTWFVAGLVPTPSAATADDPLVSPYN